MAYVTFEQVKSYLSKTTQTFLAVQEGGEQKRFIAVQQSAAAIVLQETAIPEAPLPDNSPLVVLIAWLIEFLTLPNFESASPHMVTVATTNYKMALSRLSLHAVKPAVCDKTDFAEQGKLKADIDNAY